jgi:processive 1,2-diacylglycerol beta-glucosyltransferase
MRAVKKILFFPLLRMPSGHHQVADTIAGYLQNRDSTVLCKKIDLMSAWNPIVERIVTNTYLDWIHYFPKNYAWVYKQMANKSNSGRSYKYYDFLFMKKMKQIIAEERPDLIVCTHGFPSYFLSQLKSKHQCPIPVINVYTDFFINDVWGREGIDYHFVPNQAVKNNLMKYNGISENQILVTGIPTDEHFEKQLTPQKNPSKLQILVSGGSVGLGNIAEWLGEQGKESEVEYFVLCGKNKKLYQKIKNLPSQNIHPLPYISSREKMNELYSNVDAIITKPGGVTISEALKKGLPIFIHSALPGQEEINLKLLKELKLVQTLNGNQPFDDQVINYLKDETVKNQFQASLQEYLGEIKAGSPTKITSFIDKVIDFNREDALKGSARKIN